MIKIIAFSVLLNPINEDISPVIIQDDIKIEARKKRAKGNRGKRRGGGGLR